MVEQPPANVDGGGRSSGVDGMSGANKWDFPFDMEGSAADHWHFEDTVFNPVGGESTEGATGEDERDALPGAIPTSRIDRAQT